MAVFERVSADLPATIKTSNYMLVAPDNASELQFQSASSLVASLPAVATVDNGFNVIVRNIGPGALSVQPAAEQQIDGEGSLSLVPGAWRWIRNDGTTWKSIASSPEDIGDVDGPASATDNAIARFDGTTGKLIQNSTAILDDAGNLVVNGNVTAIGTIGASNLSGTNTGDQTITLTGDVTGSGTGSFAATIANNAVTTAKINDAAVTYAKMQDVSAASRLLGRGSAGGAGDVQEISLGTGLSMSGTTLSSPDQTITLTGDVTGSGTGSFATTIANGAVTVAKLADAAKPYDFSFVAGFDATMTLEDITVQNYGQLVIARSLTIEGEVGYIDTVATGSAAIVDILKNGTTIYSSKPQFAVSTNTLSAGTLSTTTLASGDRLTFSVTQVGSTIPGQGIRFTLKTHLA